MTDRDAIAAALAIARHVVDGAPHLVVSHKEIRDILRQLRPALDRAGVRGQSAAVLTSLYAWADAPGEPHRSNCWARLRLDLKNLHAAQVAQAFATAPGC